MGQALPLSIPVAVVGAGAMGAGIAARKTPTPWANRWRSLANHTVFGVGLYLAAAGIAWATR